MGNCRNSGPSIYILQGYKSTLEIIPLSQKHILVHARKITEALHIWEEPGVPLRTETTGELYLQLCGGQYRRRGILGVLRA